MEKDTQSRKWLLTFNNPLGKGLGHEAIKAILSGMKPIVYWVMSDEIGEEKTPHTHLFFACSSPMRFSTVKRCFPAAHLDNARGACEEIRAYVLKIGKWEIDPKGETRLDNTQEEWGTMPIEQQGQRNDLAELYNMIESGMSNFQIISQNPDHILQIDKLERVRQTIREEAAKNEFRHLSVTFIQGETETGGQYISETFDNLLNKCGVKQSFSATGCPYDNAVAETFFATFKKEEAYRRDYSSEQDFHKSVANYIAFYNDKRPHKTLAYKTPNRFEELFGKEKKEKID